MERFRRNRVRRAAGKRRRAGWSLLELAVALFVVVDLMALLLPWIDSLREPLRRMRAPTISSNWGTVCCSMLQCINAMRRADGEFGGSAIPIEVSASGSPADGCIACCLLSAKRIFGALALA